LILNFTLKCKLPEIAKEKFFFKSTKFKNLYGGLNAGGSFVESVWYLGRVQDDCGSRSVGRGEIVCETSISKITRAKWTGDVD
jgi:hypothetical protein